MNIRRQLATYAHTLHAQATVLAGVLVLAATLATAGIVYLDVSSGNAYTQADTARARQLDLANLYGDIKNEQAGLAGYAYSHDPRFLEEDGSNFGPLLAKIRQEANPGELPALSRLGTTIDAWQAWATARRDALATYAPQPEPATSLQGKALFDNLLAAFAPVQSRASRDAESALAQARAQTRLQAFGTLAAAIVCVGLLMVLVAIFVRSTLSPLRSLVRTARALASANRVAIPWVGRRDEVGDLARALATWKDGEDNRLLLSTAMAEMSSEVDVARIFEAAVPRLLTLFAAQEVVISLVEDGRPMVALSEPNRYVHVGDELPALSPGGRALASSRPLIGNLTSPEWDSNLRQFGLGPVLSMPLVCGGRVLGVATVLRDLDKPGFGEADLHQAEVAGPFVAAAVQAARLLNTLETANDELERASRLKSEFLASMSHELRTPLNAILGFSELLLDADSKRQPERATRYLGNIRKSGQHLLVMVSEILDLSKIEAGRMELDCSALRLADVVDPTISMLEPQATAKNIRISVSIDEELDLIADPVRLQQVLLNLLSNAVKFTPEGGEVSLSATSDDSEVCIIVKDTGSGIAKEDQARIFEKFEQAVNGRDKTAEGTGLGLALTKSLVELHGGAISLESERGAGATFRVRLPRNGVAATAA